MTGREPIGVGELSADQREACLVGVALLVGTVLRDQAAVDATAVEALDQAPVVLPFLASIAADCVLQLCKVAQKDPAEFIQELALRVAGGG